MTIDKVLTTRFTEAIRKSFNDCPLIGKSWFQWNGNAEPPFFRFTGAKKLAKASLTKPGEIVRRILRHLDTDGLDVEVKVTAGCDINVLCRTPSQDDKDQAT